MPFQPGHKYSKGRPRVRDSLADAVRHKWPPDRILSLVDELLASDDEDLRYRVMTFLADRGYGKAKEVVEVKNELTPEEFAEECRIMAREYIDSLPVEEKLRLIEERANPAPSDTIQ